jgi:hypothetical protein
MDISKGLRTKVRPRSSPFALGIARTLAPLFEDDARIEVEATDTGLVVGGIWQPDLDRARELITASHGGELSWDDSHIHRVLDGEWKEPLLVVRVLTPPDFVGYVIGDLSARRGVVHGQADRMPLLEITAEVPLSELNGYLQTLHAMTNGTASATASFHSYIFAPRRPEPPDDEPASAALRA